MPDFSKRSSDPEIMDDLTCSGQVVHQTLRELEFINLTLGGNQVTINGLAKLLKNLDLSKEITIADLGCGSGDMLRLIDFWANKHQRKVKLIGIDANPHIIAFAKENLKANKHILLEVLDIFSEEFRQRKFDVIIGTLFYHHFTREQLIHFFSQLKNQLTVGMIINDIHRHPLAYYSIKYLTKFFSKSSMVKYDAPLSVLRAFKRKELEEILEKAGIYHYQLQWKWAFRWQVVVKSVTVQSSIVNGQ